jgi:uncharacterized protein YndB with AHSA1/START domain
MDATRRARSPVRCPNKHQGDHMASYAFVTEWEIAAPIDQVWSVIVDPASWPQWWRGVRSTRELAHGDARGLGGVWRYEWRSYLPYSLVFDMRVTAIVPPYLLEGRASGQLDGEGRWRLSETATGTHVRYEWNVRTTEWWMNLLSPIARPAFAWNHDVVMRWGQEGLRRRLGLPPVA